MAGEIELLTVNPLLTHIVGHDGDGLPGRLPVGARTLLCTGQAIAGPADTNLNTLRSVVIPANLLGLNGALEIESLWSFTNSANNKTVGITFGSMVLLNAALTTSARLRLPSKMWNRGASNSQIGMPNVTGSTIWGASGASLQTGSVDTTADVTLSFTGQKALGSETLTLEAVSVVFLPGA